ncbi:pPIWI-associating nuclease domain-containing protein [Anabaena azotica]|uniref:Predicted pPIWI-associating nuclease domain-containing protein n=1 Tax=Anabaena azotica FACHB-119 TaxID=947527 RepID=A0ABR8D7J3_9NOST|nr:hypothetical protein [Anabaena azotica]MBD2502891.1 hypothetical protein [Anabaena azotica FACHB-119]
MDSDKLENLNKASSYTVNSLRLHTNQLTSQMDTIKGLLESPKLTDNFSRITGQLEQIKSLMESPKVTDNLNRITEQSQQIKSLVGSSSLTDTLSRITEQSQQIRSLVGSSSLTDTLSRITEQSQQIRSLAGSSSLTEALSRITEQSQQIRSLAGSSSLTEALSRITEQSQQIRSMVDSSRVVNILENSLRQTEDIEHLIGASKFTDLTEQVEKAFSLVRTLRVENLTQISLTRLKLEDIGKSVLLKDDLRISLITNFDKLLSSYSRLAKLRDSETFDAVPAELILEQPALEMLESVSLLEVISEEPLDKEIEAEKNDIRREILTDRVGLEQLLINIGAEDLVGMWQGATEALESERTDYARHFSVSLRELFTHIIHRLSPDKEIRNWSNNSELFDKEGKPTRKARLLFICRAVNHDIFTDFINKDITAMLEFINLFQRGTHQVDSPFTPQQLLVLKYKFESNIRFLIDTWRFNNE